MQKLMRLLESKAFWAPVLALCVLYAFCVGFYMPNIWSINYYTVSFFDGFFRRSLIGTFLYPFGGLRLDYHFVACIQLLVGAILLALVLRKVLSLGNRYIYIYLSVFFVSRYGAFFFNSQGYPEYVMYLVVLLSFQVKNNIARALMVASTVWMHEMAVFTCVPLWFAIEYVCHRRRGAAMAGLAASFASFAAIYLFFQTVDNKTAAEYVQLISSAAYMPKYDYVQVFVNDFLGERFRLVSYYGESVFEIDGVWILYLSLAASVMAVSARGIGALAVVIVFSAALFPILMGWFGYDVNRWVFLSWFNVLLLFMAFAGGMGKKNMIAFVVLASTGLLLTAPQPVSYFYRVSIDGVFAFIVSLPVYVQSVPLL